MENKLAGQENQQPVARRLAISGSALRNQLATSSALNQPFQLGQVSSLQTNMRGNPFPPSSTQTGSRSIAGLSQLLPPTTAAVAGGNNLTVAQASNAPMGSSLGSVAPRFQPSTRTSATSVATHTTPPIPPARSRFKPGLQLGQGIQNCQFESVAQQTGIGSGLPSLQLPLPSTTSGDTVTQAQYPPVFGFASTTTTTTTGQVSAIGLGGQSTTVTTVHAQTSGIQSQTSGGLFGSRPLFCATTGQQSQNGIGTSSTPQNQLNSQVTQAQALAQALAQAGGGFSHGTTSTMVPGFGGIGGRGGLFRGRGSLTGFQCLLDQHVQPIQASSSTFGTGFATTQAPPQRGLTSNFGYVAPSAQQSVGPSLSAPAQPVQSQPSSSSGAAVRTAQLSDLATTSATQRNNVLYIPRQPTSRAGGSNNTGQVSIASNTENSEEQSSPQKQAFSRKLIDYDCVF